MPKKLPIVDDQPMVLDGLRRALRDMQFEWEKFVDTEPDAREELDRERCNSLSQKQDLSVTSPAVSPANKDVPAPQSKKIVTWPRISKSKGR